MSLLDHTLQQILSTLLIISARKETLTLIQRGGVRYAQLWAQQRAFHQQLASRLGVATSCELAQLEARLELARAAARSLAERQRSETPMGQARQPKGSSSSRATPAALIIGKDDRR